MPVASSVLFHKINARHFLVTAAHVFKRHEFESLGRDLCLDK